MTRQVILVTGASRGAGAAIAAGLAGPDRHVVVNYREKAKRADDVVATIRAAGGAASAMQADLTDEAAVAAMLDDVRDWFGQLDVLILNASGGLERGADEGYPMRLNRDAQIHLARAAIPLMGAGGRIVFVTSHLAHFYGRRPVPPDYVPVAESKQAGELALRGMSDEFEAAGITFIVVSGDMIEDSIMVRLFDRRDPQAVSARRDASGGLPTAEQFARAIVESVDEPHRTGDTVYVGGPDYFS
ncbi:SDR family oxidoreductase [Mycolicibacterium agri]|uniref:Short chain dehydrogenase n=1 Tax=Mycolicibacterium agri TaxID=36811 RepID=A0A7I9VYL2_MYCAG|nr:SDR family oxidoreductase [Mycolicibacterium agri]GFG50076.1 short chain dehydrogenase [Mycolicibacterium agri]